MAGTNVDLEVADTTFFPGFVDGHVEFSATAVKC